MKKELLFGISLGIFLVGCIAMSGIASAQDAGGAAQDSASQDSVLGFIRGLVQTATGKPTQLNQNPTAIERLTALTMIIILLGCLLSLLAFPLKLLKHIFGDGKDTQEAPSSNIRQVKKSSNESEQDQQKKKPNMILLLIILVIFIGLFALTYAGYIDFSNFGSGLTNFSDNLAWYSILILPILIGIILFYVAYRRKKISKKL